MMGYGRGVVGSILSYNSHSFQPKDQPVTDTASRITAEFFLTRLADRGVEYVLANAGTDFAPIIEALSRSPGTNRKYPRVITVPHENVAVAMAHGYYRVSGKPAVVMVHVTVGTANAICGIMNASRDNAPILLGAGRTPVTETGHQASRNRSIHWGQEMFDQGGLTREFVKWDFELRAGQSAESVVDRALDIAMSEPRGPVYLTLPREVLADHAVAPRRETSRSLGASAPVPSRAAIEEAAALIAKAEFPLILTSSAGRAPEAMAALAALADEFALPVVQSEARDISLPTDHAMCLGFDPAPHLGKADVIAVFDSAVPWIPRAHALRQDAKVICLGPDPLFTRYPFREFEGDLLITGESCAAFTMLREALGEATKGHGAAIAARRKAIAGLREDMLARRRKLIEQVKTPVAGPPALPRPLPQRAQVQGRHHRQRARPSRRRARPHRAADLSRLQPRRRPRLRARRRPRRQARRTRSRGHRRGRRRLLLFRQSAWPSTMSAARRSCRRSLSSPTIMPGTRCARRPATSIPTATPPRPMSCRWSSSTRRRHSRWWRNPAAAAARRSRRRTS